LPNREPHPVVSDGVDYSNETTQFDIERTVILASFAVANLRDRDYFVKWYVKELPTQKPLLQHRPRESDVPPYADARQFVGAYSVVDPARLDREKRRDLLGPQERPVPRTDRRHDVPDGLAA
jgi:hypothetical protein